MASEVLRRKVFFDSSMQSALERDGYVVIPGFLNSQGRTALSDLYVKYSPAVKTGFHVTNWIKDSNYSREAHEMISSVISGKLAALLDNYKPVLGCFAVKETGHDNTMGLHQDWSVTDEDKYYGVSAWIPLVDVGEDSGAVKVLKGSHLLFKNIRGQKIKNQLDDLPKATIGKYLTPVPMRAGDLLVLHHRLVHCSGQTTQRRIAAMMALIPSESEVRHYVANDSCGKNLKVYNCPDDFYVHFDIESTPAPELEMADVEQTEVVVTEPMIVDYYSK